MENGYYASCPKCGRQVMKVLPGSQLETHCDKCRALLSVVCKERELEIAIKDEK